MNLAQKNLLIRAKKVKKPVSKTFGFDLTLFTSYLAFTVIFYSALANKPFSMDDPRFLLNAQNSDGVFTLTDIFGSYLAYRIRPISDTALYLFAKVAGENPTIWWVINCVLIAGIALILHKALSSKGKITLAVVLTCLVFISSRFLQYNASQVMGAMESINLLLLVTLYSKIKAHINTGKNTYLYSAAAVFTALTLSHERFQTVYLALVTYLFVSKLDRGLKWMHAAFFSIPLIGIALWRLCANIPQLIGTGSVTDLGFSWITTGIHIIEGSLQLLGVNFGPPYLVGVSFEVEPLIIQVISLLTMGAGVILLLRVFLKFRREQETNERSLLTFQIGLLFTTFISGMVTMRLEQRWLAAPLVIMLIIITSHARNTKKEKTILSIFIAGSLISNMYFVSNSSQIFFRGAQDYAQKILNVMGPAWGVAAKSDSPIILISSQDAVQQALNFTQILSSNSPFQAEIQGAESINAAKKLASYSSAYVFEINQQTGDIKQTSIPVGGIFRK